MQVVLNVKGSSRTTGSGCNREVVALYGWPLVQVPLYLHLTSCIHVCTCYKSNVCTHMYSILHVHIRSLASTTMIIIAPFRKTLVSSWHVIVSGNRIEVIPSISKSAMAISRLK